MSLPRPAPFRAALAKRAPPGPATNPAAPPLYGLPDDHAAPPPPRRPRCSLPARGDGRLLESQTSHPPAVHQRPRRPIVVMAVAQQESRKLLTGLTQTADSRQTGAHEVADRLMSLIGNPDRGRFTGPVQLGQIDRVPPIGLDPISWLAWDQRRSHDHAIVPGKRQLPLNPIAARSSLITEPKLVPDARQLRRQSLHGRRRVRDLAILAHVVRRPASASATAIVSLCTSRPTYVIILSKTRLLCMRLCAGTRRNPRQACIL